MDNLGKQLKTAHRKEKDLNTRDRILAIHMVRVNGKDIGEAASNLLRCPEWVSQWLRRFDEEGIDGLRDLP